jgi:uncharacterized membrane protein
MAGVGAILLIFYLIPFAGLILGIIGAVLLLMGIKGLADYYQDSGIYQNALMGVVYIIIGIVATLVIFIGFIFGSIFAGLFALGLLVVAVVVLFVFTLLGAMSFRKSFSMLAQKSGEHMFETAGLILFIGAVLTIILVGLPVVAIAWILLAVAFFSIKPPVQPSIQPYSSAQPPMQPSSSTPTPQPVVLPVTEPTTPTLFQTARYCPNCGSPVDLSATYCPHCGKQLPPP